MPTTDTHTTPTSIPQRKLTPDLARGFMLLLIAMAYSGIYLTASDVGGYGSMPGGSGLDQTVSFTATLLLENRAFPLFGIMFGIGMVMLVTRQSQKGTSEADSRRLLKRRALWLLVFGIAHAILVFPGEILAAYGLATLILAWLLFRPSTVLARAAAIVSVYYVVVIMLGSLAMGAYAQEMDEGDFAIPGYLTATDWVERMVSGPIAPLFNVFFFPTLILVIIGIIMGRKGYLDDPERHRHTLRKLAIGGITISVLGALPMALAGAGALDLSDAAYGLTSGLQILTGIIGGIGYVAAFALLGIRLERSRGPITRALAAGGQRSLTLYLYCSVMIAVVMHPDLIGIGDHTHRAGAVTIAFLIWVSGIVLMRAQDSAGKPGPADKLLRTLVYRPAKQAKPTN
ncbi:DUF418 domain-containing protein [Natronoglycomyces albus]|uniref:DUF418 domain-containing protein n=1 Tax=Natronoglycomyces albus TaxID=2811108 RepID=A0A895XH09_9ACTN|nr:DUF418 domain-containing protein [Natronoglycomyces albus]QSB04634.1 DUF418 domain-containing protein [Natronoglycomyces albus]